MWAALGRRPLQRSNQASEHCSLFLRHRLVAVGVVVGVLKGYGLLLCQVACVLQLVVVLVDPLDLGAAVLYVRVLFPCSEGEGLLHLFDEFLEAGVVHISTAEDDIHMETKKSQEWWLSDSVAIVIRLV